ncbi:hypothetical protein D3C73_820510 [compost metagenome]
MIHLLNEPLADRYPSIVLHQITVYPCCQIDTGLQLGVFLHFSDKIIHVASPLADNSVCGRIPLWQHPRFNIVMDTEESLFRLGLPIIILHVIN